MLPTYGRYSSYSSQHQDIFVVACTRQKIGGTYLEIGAGPPMFSNNTYLLESKLSWTGVAIELNPYLVNMYNMHRKNPCLIGDASAMDYTDILNSINLGPRIDYLQVDIDPATVTLETLKRIDFSRFQFSIVMFEHDYYHEVYRDTNPAVRRDSREFLESFGYRRVVSDVIESRRNPQSGEYHGPFEDWYVHPDYIEHDVWKEFDNAWVVMDPSGMNETTRSLFTRLLSDGN